MTSASQPLRHIPLEGVSNLRDLGGYSTEDGKKKVRWGVLYRCDQLADIPPTTAAAALVAERHIHHSYDLRGDAEAAMKMYRIDGLCRHAVPIDVAKVDAYLRTETAKDEATMVGIMQDIYRNLVQHHGPTVGGVVKSIIESSPSSENASLIHCTAGKDRTGWTCFVILSLLGVTEAEKRKDYLLTNQYFKHPKNAYDYLGGFGMSEAAIKVLWNVCDDFLDAAVEEVEKLGGVESYAISHMNLTSEDIKKLRDALLE